MFLFLLVLDLFSNKSAAAAAFSSEIDFESDNAKTEWTQDEIIPHMKTVSKERKFEESVDLVVKLNVDPT